MPKTNLSKDYDHEYFALLESADQIETPRNLRILKQIEKFAPKKGLILDVGVGSGLFLRLAQKSGWNVAGIDVSEYAIKNAKKQIKGKLEIGQLKNGSWASNYFNAINMRHTIEHVQDPLADLKKSYSLLKPGGIIAIATPNSFGPHAKLFGKDWPHLSLPYHLHFFSKSSLKKLVQEAGFEVLLLRTEELSSYDPLKLAAVKLGIKKTYNRITGLSSYLNEVLADLGFGEGLLLVARKPKK